MADQSFNERQRLVQAAIQAARGSSDLYIVELYDDRAIYESYGEGTDSGKSFEVPYTIADDLTVTLGDRKEVVRETTYRPAAVKFVGKDTIEGPAFLFTSPFKSGRDVHGETFTPETDFCLEWFGKSGRPVLYEHGLDDSLKASVIGRQTEYESRAEGIWAQSQLDRNAQYRKTIDRMIEREALSYSGGAMPHLGIKSRDGSIKRFPWVELSLTPTPANPGNAGVYYVKSAAAALAHFEAIDLDLPDPLKAALAALDEWALTNDDDSLPDGLKFADLVDRLSVDGPAWVKARRDWYAKSGRVLSASTRERLMRHPASLRELADDLDGLLTDADAPKAGKSDLWAEAIQAEMTAARLLGVTFDAGDPIQ